ncbi:MAG: hypothetical protein ABFD92_10995 [Planctomycetaceae bacterium]|nr:hypothetical protein [Planctomycetaceae bacterium]
MAKGDSDVEDFAIRRELLKRGEDGLRAFEEEFSRLGEQDQRLLLSTPWDQNPGWPFLNESAGRYLWTNFSHFTGTDRVNLLVMVSRCGYREVLPALREEYQAVCQDPKRTVVESDLLGCALCMHKDFRHVSVWTKRLLHLDDQIRFALNFWDARGMMGPGLGLAMAGPVKNFIQRQGPQGWAELDVVAAATFSGEERGKAKRHPRQYLEAFWESARGRQVLLDSWIWTGRICRHEQEYATAETCLREAILIDPKNAMAKCFLAGVLLRSGKESEASELLKDVAAVPPRNVEVLSDLGVSLYYLKDYPGATKALRMVLELDSQNGTAIQYLALAEWGRGNKSEAQRLTSRLKELDAGLWRQVINWIPEMSIDTAQPGEAPR